MALREGSNPLGKLVYGKLVDAGGHCWLFRNTVNSGVIITDEGVVVVDTQINEPMARRLIAMIRAKTDKPILYAINTHYHWDHWAGNDVFAAAGATLICGNLTREFMERRNRRQRGFLTGRGFSMPPNDPVRPRITFDEALDLRVGGVDIQVRHLGKSESDDAMAVHVPADGVVVSGDTLMTGSFPIFGQPVTVEGMAEDRAWIRTLQRLKALQPRAIIPGHGPLATIADCDFLIDLQVWLLDTSERMMMEGHDDRHILATMEADLPARFAAMPQVWGTPRYAILRALRTMRGWQHEKPSAIPDVLPADLEAARKDLAPQAPTYIDAAETLANRGQVAVSLGLLREATQRFPDDASTWAARGKALITHARMVESVLEKGDFFMEARQCLEKALSIDGAHPSALVTLGGFLALSAWRSGDDPQSAIDLLDRAHGIELGAREKAEAYFYRGMAYRANEREADAQEEFRTAVATDPTYPPPHLAMAGPNAVPDVARPGGRGASEESGY